MQKLYKLTQGTVSVIRTDRAGVEEAQAAGYALMGECNDKYEIVSTTVSFEDEEAVEKARAEKAARDAIEAEAKELKVGSAKIIAAMSDIDLAAAVEKARAEKA